MKSTNSMKGDEPWKIPSPMRDKHQGKYRRRKCRDLCNRGLFRVPRTKRFLQTELDNDGGGYSKMLNVHFDRHLDAMGKIHSNKNMLMLFTIVILIIVALVLKLVYFG